ncbi:hypothetical protein TYRP_010329 [Tyrophagus putrescentiae]|nr:hypothetical protein TYRP_010329 [Tyrophagus putrescentiae]
MHLLLQKLKVQGKVPLWETAHFLMAKIVAGHPMIINGEAVPVGEARYQLALYRHGTFICGAALIAPRTAITAGHCVYGFDLTADHFSLRLGSLNLTEILFLFFSQICRRSASRPSPRLHLGHLQRRPCSVDPLRTENDLITVQGWGQTSSGTTSEWLMRAKLRVNNFEQCRKVWATDGQPVLAGSMFCASGEQQSSCKGDSGGPVVISSPDDNGDGIEKLVGVVSWGSRYCLDERFPNVYARVTGKGETIRNWIALNTVY